MLSLAVGVTILGLWVFGWRRTLSYLRYFQQEEYTHARFNAWMRKTRAYDRRGTWTMSVVALAAIFIHDARIEILLAVASAAVLIAIVFIVEDDPRVSGKIRLNMTERATKIAYVAMALYIGLSLIPLGLACASCNWAQSPFDVMTIFSLALIHTPPALLVVANAILSPAEKAVQQRFYADARRILREVDPFVVGITGSYGKTGAKAALGDLLTQCLGPTFWPTKSINTVMGITRTIRDSLKPHHRFAVIEMGAYNVGSIKRLCDFTPPKAALVTAVGIMHLERFGSPENVYRAKSEIAEALPPDGVLVCNGDSPNARRMALAHGVKTTLLYGLDLSQGHLDCYASDLSFSELGSHFTIHWRGEHFPAFTPLLGRPAVLNILGAFTMVCALGAQPAFAVACLANMQPVDNRLVLDRSADVAFLRDAYNSNPTGFAAALEVLKTLPADRRIVMTPGMIELGEQQFEENKKIGTEMARVADLVIVVGKTNRDALTTGLREALCPPDKIVIVDTREEAFAVVRGRAARGDIVLIENDLGDLYEARVKF